MKITQINLSLDPNFHMVKSMHKACFISQCFAYTELF